MDTGASVRERPSKIVPSVCRFEYIDCSENTEGRLLWNALLADADINAGEALMHKFYSGDNAEIKRCAHTIYNRLYTC